MEKVDLKQLQLEDDEQKPVNIPIKSGTSRNLMSGVYYGTAEKTFYESANWSDSQYAPYNSDDLFQKNGDHSIYDDMVLDDQVSVLLKLKKDMVLSSGWDVVPEDDSMKEMAEFLDRALAEDSESPFDEQMEQILSAYEYGFSLSEKIFKFRKDGLLTWSQCKTRHPDTWIIHTDPHGNIEKYEQYAVKSGSVFPKPKSLIHYINNPKFGNVYGHSDLRPAYAAWFAKRQIIRYFAIFLEKAASPIPVARYEKGLPSARITELNNVIKKFMTKTSITIPKDVELEFLESKSIGEAYHKALAIFNNFIGRSMFVPDLLGFQGSQTGGGSYSLGQEQFGIFYRHIERRRKVLENIINKEIIWPMVIYNYGYIDNYPKFKFRPLQEEDTMGYAKLFLEAVKSKLYKPTDEEINYFRRSINYPESEEIERESPTEIVDMPSVESPIIPDEPSDPMPPLPDDDQMELPLDGGNLNEPE